MAFSGSNYDRFDHNPGAHKASQRSELFTNIIRPSVCEFTTMSFFTFLGTMPILLEAVVKGPGQAVVGIAIANGLTIMVCVISTIVISGCHINPVVTLAFYLCGHVKLGKALCFVVAQLLGAILGVLFVRGVLPEDIFLLINKGGAATLPATVTVWQAILCEASLTSLLVLVLLLVGEQEASVLGPLSIGCIVMAAVMAGAGVSGPSMNPARAFGPAVVATLFDYGSSVWDYHYIFWVGPTAGTLLATAFYVLMFRRRPSREGIQDGGSSGAM